MWQIAVGEGPLDEPQWEGRFRRNADGQLVDVYWGAAVKAGANAASTPAFDFEAFALESGLPPLEVFGAPGEISWLLWLMRNDMGLRPSYPTLSGYAADEMIAWLDEYPGTFFKPPEISYDFDPSAWAPLPGFGWVREPRTGDHPRVPVQLHPEGHPVGIGQPTRASSASMMR